MIKIKIKPISVNDAWRGRRFKTDKYKMFELELGYLLPRLEVPNAKLSVTYHFGLSNKKSDGDNCIKQFQDILTKKYGFDDSMIYKWDIQKFDVKKDEEFISFKIETWNQSS